MVVKAQGLTPFKEADEGSYPYLRGSFNYPVSTDLDAFILTDPKSKHERLPLINHGASGRFAVTEANWKLILPAKARGKAKGKNKLKRYMNSSPQRTKNTTVLLLEKNRRFFGANCRFYNTIGGLMLRKPEFWKHLKRDIVCKADEKERATILKAKMWSEETDFREELEPGKTKSLQFPFGHLYNSRLAYKEWLSTAPKPPPKPPTPVITSVLEQVVPAPIPRRTPESKNRRMSRGIVKEMARLSRTNKKKRRRRKLSF